MSTNEIYECDGNARVSNQKVKILEIPPFLIENACVSVNYEEKLLIIKMVSHFQHIIADMKDV
jgi:hypothetical protein